MHTRYLIITAEKNFKATAARAKAVLQQAGIDMTHPITAVRDVIESGCEFRFGKGKAHLDEIYTGGAI